MSGRILAVDWARSLALANMAAFHFLYDLRLFALAPDWMTYGPLYAAWAKGIAGTFLFLAGVSLWLAHGPGIRWRGYLTRLAMLAGAAALVSIATYFAVPQAWVRFGILHSIAVSSLVALPFLRVPWPVTAGVAAAILWWGPGFAIVGWDAPWLIWTGVGTYLPPMVDYEPLIPWVAPMLLGVAAGRLGTGLGVWDWMARRPAAPGRLAEALAWPGRHSLAVYLLHQPVLIAGILAVAWVLGLM